MSNGTNYELGLLSNMKMMFKHAVEMMEIKDAQLAEATAEITALKAQVADLCGQLAACGKEQFAKLLHQCEEAEATVQARDRVIDGLRKELAKAREEAADHKAQVQLLEATP